MFDISSSELVVIALVALIVLGPRHLPELMRKMGRAYGELQRAVSDLRTGLESEIDEVRRPFDEAAGEVRGKLNEAGREVRRQAGEVKGELEAVRPDPDRPSREPASPARSEDGEPPPADTTPAGEA